MRVGLRIVPVLHRYVYYSYFCPENLCCIFNVASSKYVLCAFCRFMERGLSLESMVILELTLVWAILAMNTICSMMRRRMLIGQLTIWNWMAATPILASMMMVNCSCGLLMLIVVVLMWRIITFLSCCFLQSDYDITVKVYGVLHCIKLCWCVWWIITVVTRWQHIRGNAALG